MQLERKLIDKPYPLIPMHSDPLDSPQTPMDIPDSSRYRGPINTPQALMVDSNVRTDEPHPPNYYNIGSAADPGSDLYTGIMGGSRVTDTGLSSSQNTMYKSTSSTLPLTPSVYRRANQSYSITIKSRCIRRDVPREVNRCRGERVSFTPLPTMR